MSRTPLCRGVAAAVTLTAALALLQFVRADDKNKAGTEIHLRVHSALVDGRDHAAEVRGPAVVGDVGELVEQELVVPLVALGLTAPASGVPAVLADAGRTKVA